MFKKARLTLTAWYLLMIMSISILFSLVIYSGIVNELNRFERRTRFRIEERFELPPSALPPNFEFVNTAEVKEKVLITLFGINLSIFFLAGLAGYFLSGKTLRPIEVMVGEQNRFVADASHELRTPLTAMRTSIEVGLRDKDISLKNAKDLLKSNLEDVASLQQLSDKLIELAQYQQGNSNVMFTKNNLQQIIKNAINKVLPLAKGKNIKIAASLKQINIEGDVTGLTELFTVFLDNAIKYSPSDSQVRISVISEKNYARIKIQDEGIGISKKDLPYIFDRFYRADKSRSKQNTEGFGLGLSIAKKIVALHNGTINVESLDGQGTVFIIRLPKKH